VASHRADEKVGERWLAAFEAVVDSDRLSKITGNNDPPSEIKH
jgi:hypothetical protein